MRAHDRQQGGPGNAVTGVVAGAVVQAGAVGGGIHVHPLAPKQPTPRQLPPVPAHFVGRAGQLTDLTSWLDATTGGASPILTLAGVGGIGKTWFAVSWAYRNLDRFPDGQLFVDLRGFSPDSHQMETAVAVRGFLDALGVDPGRLPTDLHAQAALFRSLVADRRMLIVLDNAACTEQVVPLLPGGGRCVVVVTSRRTLTTLVSRYGAYHLRLAPLTTDDGHTLLADRLGRDRLAAEPAAVAEMVAFCRGHALALGVVAGRAHVWRHAPLARLATELRELGLDALDGDDPSASLPTVLSWSYHALSAEEQRVFRLLSVTPGLDTAPEAATSLTGLTPARTRRLLCGLEEAALLDRDARGRYATHDLVRAYAANLAERNAAKDALGQAMRRVLGFYAHTAHAADRLLAPHRQPVTLTSPAPGVRPAPPPDARSALDWFDTEHANLLAAQHTATAWAQHRIAWLLAWALDAFHGRRGHLRDRVSTWRTATEAAANLAEPLPLTRAHRFLGRALAHLGHHDEALEHLHHALALAENNRDRAEHAHTHRMLSWAWRQHADNTADRAARHHAVQALELFRGLDQPVWEADALNQLGWHAARLGDLATGRARCQAALDLYRRHPNPDGEAATHSSLGYIHHHMGRHHEAVGHYRQALARYRNLGNTYATGEVLEGLAHPHAALGQSIQARALRQEALELYQHQGRHEDTVRVRRQLDT